VELDDFLLARIAEDEAFLHADDREPHARHLGDTVGTYNPDCPTCRGLMLQGKERQVAECKAKRRIVRQHEVSPTGDCDLCDQQYDTLRLLALPYAGHEAYREEWGF
jgi:hypothetical protein